MDPLLLIVVILLIAWGLGMWAVPSIGGLIHILLVIVLIVLIVRMLQNRKV